MKLNWATLVACSLVTSALLGCGAGPCTTEARPAINLSLVAADVSAEALCRAQVIAYDEGGFVTFAQGYESLNVDTQPSCNYSFAHEHAGTYTVQIQVQGFESVLLEGVEVTEGRCHVNTVELVETLNPTTSLCHDGYEWIDNTCKTPNGCEFPLFEQEVIPGVQGAQITYDCVRSCETIDGLTDELPQAPGRCASLPLP